MIFDLSTVWLACIFSFEVSQREGGLEHCNLLRILEHESLNVALCFFINNSHVK